MKAFIACAAVIVAVLALSNGKQIVFGARPGGGSPHPSGGGNTGGGNFGGNGGGNGGQTFRAPSTNTNTVHPNTNGSTNTNTVHPNTNGSPNSSTFKQYPGSPPHTPNPNGHRPLKSNSGGNTNSANSSGNSYHPNSNGHPHPNQSIVKQQTINSSKGAYHYTHVKGGAWDAAEWNHAWYRHWYHEHFIWWNGGWWWWDPDVSNYVVYTEGQYIPEDYYAQGDEPPAQGGEAIRIVNPVDNQSTINYTINDTDYQLDPGKEQDLTADQQYVIEFDRGETDGAAQYTLSDGEYDFGPSDHGWELYHPGG